MSPETAARLDGPAPETVSLQVPSVSPRVPLARLIALNLPPVAVLAASAHAGLMDRFVDDASLGVSCGLVAVPVVTGLAAIARRIWRGEPLVQLREYAVWTVTLGLIGTVLGFIIALDGIDPGRAADVTAMTPMLATMIVGMSIALHTTLVGAVGGLWLRINLYYLR